MCAKHHFYILTKGTLRLEKLVDVEKKNQWPINARKWEHKITKRKVAFKFRDVDGVHFIGEREFVK